MAMNMACSTLGEMVNFDGIDWLGFPNSPMDIPSSTFTPGTSNFPYTHMSTDIHQPSYWSTLANFTDDAAMPTPSSFPTSTGTNTQPGTSGFLDTPAPPATTSSAPGFYGGSAQWTPTMYQWSSFAHTDFDTSGLAVQTGLPFSNPAGHQLLPELYASDTNSVCPSLPLGLPSSQYPSLPTANVNTHATGLHITPSDPLTFTSSSTPTTDGMPMGIPNPAPSNPQPVVTTAPPHHLSPPSASTGDTVLATGEVSTKRKQRGTPATRFSVRLAKASTSGDNSQDAQCNGGNEQESTQSGEQERPAKRAKKAAPASEGTQALGTQEVIDTSNDISSGKGGTRHGARGCGRGRARGRGRGRGQGA